MGRRSPGQILVRANFGPSVSAAAQSPPGHLPGGSAEARAAATGGFDDGERAPPGGSAEA